VCSRRGATQIHVYLTLPYLTIVNWGWPHPISVDRLLNLDGWSRAQ